VLRHVLRFLPQHIGDGSIVEAFFAQDRRNGVPEPWMVSPGSTLPSTSRRMRSLRHAARKPLSVHTQPNSWNHFLSDHAVIFDILPLTPHTTRLRTRWLVHKDAIEGTDYALDNLTKVWRTTNDQDATFVGWQQCGVRSPAYEPGPYTPNENQAFARRHKAATGRH